MTIRKLKHSRKTALEWTVNVAGGGRGGGWGGAAYV